MDKIEKAINDLKETYPKVIPIVDNWAMMDHVHGGKQSDSEKKILNKFAKAMKVITDYDGK